VQAVAPTRPSPLRVGTVVWLASELMFFAGLFAAYFGLRALDHPWPPSGVELDTARTAAFTALLVGSSFTYHRAARAAEHDDARGVARWTAVTVVLAALFLANQALEYVQVDFTLTTHAYGSMFFLMTGFHGAHVIGGLVLMIVVLGVGSGRDSRAPLGEVVTVSEFYWHFVDAVWVVMFATLYMLR
jgi:cytochrome c oxidase subunit III